MDKDKVLEINLQERNRFWRVIAGLWAAGALMLTALYKFLFRKPKAQPKQVSRES